MFWRKKAPVLTEDQVIVQMIAEAHGSGNQRIELTCRLLQVAQEAESFASACKALSITTATA